MTFCPINFVSGNIRTLTHSCDNFDDAAPGPSSGSSRDNLGHEIKDFYEDLTSCSNSVNDDKTPSSTSIVDTEPRRTRRKRRSKETISSTDSKKKSENQQSLSKSIHQLYHGTQHSDIKAVKAALENDQTDVNCQDIYGWTPLMSAAHSGSLDIVLYLLEKGADVGIINKRGDTVCDIVRTTKNRKLLTILVNPEEYFQKQKEAECASKNDSEDIEFFYCDVCNCDIKKSNQKTHLSSTTHLINKKHPGPPAFYQIPQSNKGYQLMIKSGWDKETGLGPDGKGKKYPIKTMLKRDRKGLGNKSKKSDKPKVTHFKANDKESVSSARGTRSMRGTTLKKKVKSIIEKQQKAKERSFREQFNME